MKVVIKGIDHETFPKKDLMAIENQEGVSLGIIGSYLEIEIADEKLARGILGNIFPHIRF